MEKRDQINELLLQWEEMRERGKQLSAEELCRDYPELLAEVRQKLQALESMKKWLAESNQGTSGGQDSGDSLGGVRTISLSEAEPIAAKEPTLGKIPGYELLQTLGRGGMGVVYKARHLQLDRVVALKMILAGSHASQADLQRFQTEARAIAQLQHPHIVQVFEVGEHEGKPYFSLEFCGGGSLDRKLAGTPLRPNAAARLVETLAKAMHYAHQRQVIHRDLKPANILLLPSEAPKASEQTTQQSSSPSITPDSTRSSGSHPPLPDLFPKITDFGLAKKLDQEAGQTHSGAVMGTPSYMAPEQAGGKTRDVGPAADIYALGAILYECLTGRPPFKAASTMDTMMQVLHDEPVPPRRLQPTIPRDLETVSLKCLQKDPKKRYASAAELAEDLNHFQTGVPIRARPVSPPERIWRWCRRNPRVAGLLALLVVVVTGAFLGLMRLYQQAEDSRLQAENDRNAAIGLQKKAEDAEHQAVAEAKKAQEVSQFLLSLFESSDPIGLQGYSFASIAGGQTQLTARDLLDRAADKLKKKQLKTSPLVQAAQMDTIGNVYRSLGLYKEAEELLLAAYKTRQEKLPPVHEEISDSLNNLGWLYHERGQYPKAKSFYEQSLAMRKQALGENHPKVTASMFNLGWLNADLGDFVEAEKLLQDVIGRRQKQHGLDEHREVAIAKVGLAAVYLDSGKFTKALGPATEAIAIFRKLGSSDKMAEALGLFQEATAFSLGLKQHAWAEERLRKCITLLTADLGDNHPYLAIATFQLGSVLEQQQKYVEAEQFYRQSLKIARATVGLAHPRILILAHHLGRLLDLKNKHDESRALFDEIRKAHEDRFGPDHPLVADVLVTQASLLSNRKTAYQEQVETLGQAVNIYTQSKEKYGKQVTKLKGALKSLSVAHWRNKAASAGLQVGLQRRQIFSTDPKELFDTGCELAFLVPLAEMEAGLSTQERQQLAERCLQESLRTLELAVAQGFTDAILVKSEPRLNPISAHPDYVALLKKMPKVDWNKVTIHREFLTKKDPYDRVNAKSHHKVFAMQLQGGKNYQIDLMSLDFDPFLRIEDAAGKQLAFDDDGGLDLNSRLQFRPAQTAEYRVITTTYRNNQTGNFSLVIREQN